jgi:hypothetical protein
MEDGKPWLRLTNVALSQNAKRTRNSALMWRCNLNGKDKLTMGITRNDGERVESRKLKLGRNEG